MANIFEKPEKFAATALELLRREIKGAGLFVNKFGRADFAGAKGDTINIKRPTVLKAYDAGFRARNARVISDIVNSSIKVSLTKFPTSEVALTPEEETLDDVDYVRDVQAPQVRALVEDFDDSIAATLAAAKFIFEVTFNPASADPIGLLTEKQQTRLTTLFTPDAHAEVEATWGVYQQLITAYREPDPKKKGHDLMVKLIASISTGVPKALVEVATLGGTLKKRAADVLAYFTRTGTSNGPTEAINGRLEHLRGSALGFRNLTNYIARSLLETGGFRPQLHPQL